MSYDNGVYGYGVVSDYSYSSGIFSSRISLRHYSKDYANLSLSALNKGKARFQGLVSAGFYHEKFGSLSGIFSVTDRYEYTDTEEFLLSYSRLLGKNLWLQITGSLTKDDDDINYELFSGLSFGFEYDISGNIHRQQNRRGTDIHAGICKNPPQNTGSGYRANAEIRENESGDSEISGDAGFQYNTDHGIYTAQYHGYRNQSIYDLKFAGSLLFIDDSFFFSRPVYDSFALVKVGDIKDVKVKSGGSDAGKTDSDGEMIAPDIVSYYHNNLSIEPSEIPIEYEIKETSKHIAVPYRSGGIVSFDVKKLRAAEGRLYFLENGEKIPAEYAVLKIRVADKTVESVTGTEGAFYLENLPAGEFSAGVFSGDKECQFDMVIPESDEITLNMGEVICELAN